MIIGHQKIIDFLNKSIKSQRLAHAYLFIGPESVGKKTISLEFAKALQCQSQQTVNSKQLTACGKCKACLEIEKNNHPDVLVIEPEVVEVKEKKREKDITIGQIRNIQHQLSLFPFQGPYKIVIIDGAEKMRREAANALLKTLEEPAGNSIIILISSFMGAVLPTITSRCLPVRFSLVSAQEIYNNLIKETGKKISGKEILSIARQSLGRPGLALSFYQNPAHDKRNKELEQELIQIIKGDLSAKFHYAGEMAKDLEESQKILSQWMVVFRDWVLQKIGCDNITADSAVSKRPEMSVEITKLTKIIKKIIETKKTISNPSFNARLALEVLMLNLM